MILGLLASSMDIVGFFFVGEYWQFLLLMALFGFGSSSVYVMSSTMAADILPEENKAMLFGAFDALIDLGMVVGPLLCFAFLAVSGLSINYSFLLAGVPSIVALGIILRIKETRNC
jgi:MFS family permease